MSTSTATIVGSSLLIALVSVVAFIPSKKTMVLPIHNLDRELEDMACGRNLSYRVDDASEVEVGTTAKSVNGLLSTFQSSRGSDSCDGRRGQIHGCGGSGVTDVCGPYASRN